LERLSGINDQKISFSIWRKTSLNLKTIFARYFVMPRAETPYDLADFMQVGYEIYLKGRIDITSKIHVRKLIVCIRNLCDELTNN